MFGFVYFTQVTIVSLSPLFSLFLSLSLFLFFSLVRLCVYIFCCNFLFCLICPSLTSAPTWTYLCRYLLRCVCVCVFAATDSPKSHHSKRFVNAKTQHMRKIADKVALYKAFIRSQVQYFIIKCNLCIIFTAKTHSYLNLLVAKRYDFSPKISAFFLLQIRYQYFSKMHAVTVRKKCQLELQHFKVAHHAASHWKHYEKFLFSPLSAIILAFFLVLLLESIWFWYYGVVCLRAHRTYMDLLSFWGARISC